MPSEQQTRTGMALVLLTNILFESGGPTPEFLEHHITTTGLDRQLIALLAQVQVAVRWQSFFEDAAPDVKVYPVADGEEGSLRVRLQVTKRHDLLPQLRSVCKRKFQNVTFEPETPKAPCALVFTVPSRIVRVLRTQK